MRFYGRLVFKRNLGGIVFISVVWLFLVFQIKLFRGTQGYNLARTLTLGDIICCVCDRLSCMFVSAFRVSYLCLVVKNFLCFPDKFFSVKDKRFSYIRAYVKFATNVITKFELYIRFKLLEFLRVYMYRCGFLEVDTPIICSYAEPCDASPFVTFHNALKKSMYLRVSPELSLKKLLVSGFSSIFEVGKNFRNESLSVRHYPEFTSCEFYKVGKNYIWGVYFLVRLLQFVSVKLVNIACFYSVVLNYDLFTGFDYLSLQEVIVKYSNFSMQDVLCYEFMYCALVCVYSYVGLCGKTLPQLWLLYFECFIQSRVLYPTFVFYFPIHESPLAYANDVYLAQRYELYVSGIEVANGFTELNNAFEQRVRFCMQSFRNFKSVNYNYIDALKFGMSSAAGCGLGVDRLLLVLLCKANIRDVIVFPELRGA